MKPIRFSYHARKRIISRGATEAEVIETIRYCSNRLSVLSVDHEIIKGSPKTGVRAP